MPFHATAAAASARPNRISTLRNHLLCSVCAAMLLAGSSTMAWAEDPAPQPVPKVSKTVEAGTRLTISEGDRVDEVVINKGGKLNTYSKGIATTVTVNEGGDAEILSQIGTATVAGKDSLLSVTTKGTVCNNGCNRRVCRSGEAPAERARGNRTSAFAQQHESP